MKLSEMIKFVTTQLLYLAQANGLTVRVTAFPDGTLDVMVHKGGERVYDLQKDNEGQWSEMDHTDYQLKKYRNGGI